MNVLVWFQRDLRSCDHPALARGAALGRVIPLYVAEPGFWAQPDIAGRHWDMVADALADLRGALAVLGAPLVVRTGDAVEVITRLVRAHRISTIISQQDPPTPWTVARDRRLAAWARDAGVQWDCLSPPGPIPGAPDPDAVIEPTAVPLPARPPVLTPVAGVEPGLIPNARALGLAPDPCPHRQPGGRAAGLALAESFAAGRGLHYRAAAGSPIGGERSGSRLSPHLAWGTLSPREVAERLSGPDPAAPGVLPAAVTRALRGQLVLRDQMRARLADDPDLAARPAPPPGAGRTASPADLAAFAAGQTGLPFADACLRYLRATGWANFRARSMLVSVAVHHLGLDWRDAGHVLARLCADYDPGIHWPQMQAQAGLAAGTTGGLRVCNPVKLGQDHDPDGSFTRRWLPELAAVPAPLLQTPWRWDGAAGLLGRRYPEPLADPAEALRRLRDRPAPLPSVTGQAARIADPVRRGPAPRRRAAPTAQLTLDLWPAG